jgi:hypothetical protein
MSHIVRKKVWQGTLIHGEPQASHAFRVVVVALYQYKGAGHASGVDYILERMGDTHSMGESNWHIVEPSEVDTCLAKSLIIVFAKTRLELDGDDIETVEE